MAKIIHYRNKCIGCGICYEMQPGIWRMSKKDGKAILLKAEAKKGLFILSIDKNIEQSLEGIAKACPAKIIKIV